MREDEFKAAKEELKKKGRGTAKETRRNHQAKRRYTI